MRETSAPRARRRVQETTTVLGRSTRRAQRLREDTGALRCSQSMEELGFPVLEGEEKVSGDPLPSINTDLYQPGTE